MTELSENPAKNALPAAAGAKQHVYYFDWLRLLAFVCVVLHHLFLQATSSRGYPLMAIPLTFARHINNAIFWCVTGYLMLSSEKTRDIKTFYKAKALRLLLPFVVWQLLYWFINIFIWKRDGAFSSVFVSISAYHLWFLQYLIALSIFAPFVKRIIDDASTRALVLLLAVCVIMRLLPNDLRRLYPRFVLLFNLDFLSEWFVYILLGYLLAKCSIGKKLTAVIYAAGSCAAAALLIIYFIQRNAESLPETPIWMDRINVIVLALASAIVLFAKNHLNIKCAPIKLLAELSFGGYLIHVFFLDLWKQLWGAPFGTVTAYFRLGLTVVCSLAVVFVIRRIKYLRAIC
ncbi:MAG: acyltransferase [Oscillospiraceae bacterium]|jgi:surface polysaccharide O-acyltransferase-like enzyme|nr:acyltransferase [Oscillospiraceae bacterium]